MKSAPKKTGTLASIDSARVTNQTLLVLLDLISAKPPSLEQGRGLEAFVVYTSHGEAASAARFPRDPRPGAVGPPSWHVGAFLGESAVGVGRPRRSVEHKGLEARMKKKAPEFWFAAPVSICGNRPSDPPKPGWVLNAVRREIGGYRPIKLHVLVLDQDGRPHALMVRRSRLSLRA
jgi:hypothetical protein